MAQSLRAFNFTNIGNSGSGVSGAVFDFCENQQTCGCVHTEIQAKHSYTQNKFKKFKEILIVDMM